MQMEMASRKRGHLHRTAPISSAVPVMLVGCPTQLNQCQKK
jgi:hypothetical protein